MRTLLRRLFPLSRAGMALWAWRNRSDIADWGRFGARAARQAAGGEVRTGDLKAELRLRAALTRHLRNHDGDLEVRVEDGVAILRGRLSPETHARVQDIAEGTAGIRRVRDHIVTTGSGRRTRLLRRSA